MMNKSDFEPCEVEDKKVLYHRWFVSERGLLEVIEYEDGIAEVIESEYIKFVDGYPKIDEEKIRVEQTRKVFEAIVDALDEGGCSYRELTFEKLGFDTDYLGDLLSGVTVANAINELEMYRKKIPEIEKDREKKAIMLNRLISFLIKNDYSFRDIDKILNGEWK